jgi:hypothetical protein
MINSITNLSVVTPAEDPGVNDDINQVFINYFSDRPVISIGSFVRKVNNILMDLCDVASGLWVIILKYETKGEKFKFIIRNIDQCISYDITCALAAGVNYASSMSIINQSFNRDKIAKHPVSYLRAKITTNHHDYVFEKKLLTDEDIAVWMMHTSYVPWYRRLFCRNILKERIIKDIKVEDYRL